jgi:integrase
MLAYTGARREEILQLNVKHLKCSIISLEGEPERELWYIDLKTDPDLKLKNDSSRRYIPLHDNLIALGIIKHLVTGRDPEKLLFNDVKKDADSKGDAFGKWALRLFKQLGLPSRGNHKWRHTVVTYLGRAAAHAGHIEEIVGHDGAARDDVSSARYHQSRRATSGASERSTYDAGLEIADLKKVVDKLTYDFDFSRLPTWRTETVPQAVEGGNADY